MERFTIDEWVCAALARTIRDTETVFHGFGSPCATIAMHIAKQTHAPAMVLVEGATYAIDPSPPFIPRTSNDWSLMRGASSVLRFEQLFDLAARGKLDRMFLSGGQIDACGNTNVTLIGRPDAIKVRLGGGGGGCNLSATARSLTVWTTHHRGGRTLVEECDFITDCGHGENVVDGRRFERTGGGPETLVTELGIFDFESGRARLRSLFPDVSVDDVRAATGFELQVAPRIDRVDLPNQETIKLIRRLDPIGVRRSEFSEAELKREFSWASP